MITRVSNILVANAACPASYTNDSALNAGEIALFDENGKMLIDKATAAKANQVMIGLCKGTMKVANPSTGALEDKKNIEFTNRIQKGSIISNVLTEYTAPTLAKIEFDLTSATIVIGHRYVLRIVYKDLYEAPGQFTHTYETLAATTTNTDLIDAFVKQINAHPNRRVTASKSGNKLVLTALDKDDNEGVNSINEYTIVSMDASLYVTIPGALLSNVPESVPGVTVTKTEGTPGKGFWKQVRDREMRTMGYKGHVFTDAYPVIEQDKMVDPSITYDSLVIEHDTAYLSPDNQYVKKAPITVELYVKSGSLESSKFMQNLTAFITGSAA